MSMGARPNKKSRQWDGSFHPDEAVLGCSHRAAEEHAAFAGASGLPRIGSPKLEPPAKRLRLPGMQLGNVQSLDPGPANIGFPAEEYVQVWSPNHKPAVT